MSDSETLQKFHDVAKKATWAYLATASVISQKCVWCIPRLKARTVGGDRAEFAKGKHIAKNPKVELFYQVGPEFIHLTVTGIARFIDDAAEKKRVWEGRSLTTIGQFWPGGHQAPDFGLMLVTPSRIELTGMMEMMQGKKPLVWRAKK